eukprot:364933-Chlamydomonas_euryale.AAC.25
MHLSPSGPLHRMAELPIVHGQWLMVITYKGDPRTGAAGFGTGFLRPASFSITPTEICMSAVRRAACVREPAGAACQR